MARSSGGSMLATGDRPSGRMEVAVAIGTEPALTFCAIVPAPPDVEEYIIAGFLRQKAVELVKCETVDLEVPANAEIILEGYVNLDELRTEGPFGDHTGFYSLEDEYPVFHVTCMTHRKYPIYATTVVGKPPQEDAWMGKAVERIFLPLMKLTIPELVDINLPIEGVFHNLMIVSIRKSYPGQARKVMNAIWSLGQAMFTKCIIVVDEDVDVQDIADVTLKVLNHIDPERDIQFTLGPVDSLDHAARLANYGSKMGIDATRKWSTEGFGRPWPDEIVMDAKTRALVDGKWKALAKELGIEAMRVGSRSGLRRTPVGCSGLILPRGGAVPTGALALVHQLVRSANRGCRGIGVVQQGRADGRRDRHPGGAVCDRRLRNQDPAALGQIA